MAATRSLRPASNALLQPSLHTPTPSSNSLATAPFRLSSKPTRQPQSQQRRTFLPNPFAGPQTLHASRTLHYPASTIYSVITDVSSYSAFIPYCQTSTVTKSSSPTGDFQTTYPEEAKLVVGFQDSMAETFWSRIYCVPGRVVEALSGDADTMLTADEISHHSPRPQRDADPTRNGSVLSFLRTRWTVKAFPYKPHDEPKPSMEAAREGSDLPSQERTDVRLDIEYHFASPVYAALSSAAAPRVAEKMIEAFERRVKEVVARQGKA